MNRWLLLLSRFVPAERRRDWLDEWRAEIAHAAVADPLRRAAAARRGALGALEDAARLAFRHRRRSPLARDVRYAVRALVRRPGFAAVAVVSLALGIGANTAIFTFVNGVLLRPLPYPNPDRLVVAGQVTGDGTALDVTTPGTFYDWQAQTTVFETMAAYSPTVRNLTGRDRAERWTGVVSAGSVFDVLGRRPFFGRVFTGADDTPDAPRVIVLAYSAWQRLFGLDWDALGRTLTLGGEDYVVVGVMPPDFVFPDHDTEYRIPTRYDAGFRGNRDQYFLRVVARLKEGETEEAARAQLGTILARIRAAHPQANQNARAALVPLDAFLVGATRPRLLIFMGAVGLLLLIACANLANLLMARAGGRRRELGVRLALGATRGQIARQLLTESVVLALAGGVAGLLLGWAMLGLLRAWMPSDLPRTEAVTLDGTVLAFTLVLSAASGLVFGVFPAFGWTGRAPVGALRDGGRGSARREWARASLVVAEVAVALVLLAGAGLLVRSFFALSAVDPGIRRDHVLTLHVNLPGAGYRTPASRVAYFRSAMDRLARLPGVGAVAIVSTLPVTGRGIGAWFNMLDRPLAADVTPPAVPYRVVSPGYFETMGVPLRRGRTFRADDRLDGTRAVVVNETLARRFFPDRDPIGRAIYLGAPDNRLFPDATIVGVVGDERQGLGVDALPVAYAPEGLMPYWSSFAFVLRTSIDPVSLEAAARTALARIDPELPVFGMMTMDDVIARDVQPARASTLLLSVFAALALVMAAVGVFGVLSYDVSRRSRELGIRMALGASRSQVRRLVLRQGLTEVLVGVAIGTAGALALTRTMASLLFDVSPGDPAAFASAAVVLLAAGYLASDLPARRATAVDPLTVLREE